MGEITEDIVKELDAKLKDAGYSDAGDVASNQITTTIKLGGYSDSTTNYMACTVHTFKVYFDAVDDSDITTLLE